MHPDNTRPLNLHSTQESLIAQNATKGDMKKTIDQLNEEAEQAVLKGDGQGFRVEAGA